MPSIWFLGVVGPKFSLKMDSYIPNRAVKKRHDITMYRSFIWSETIANVSLDSYDGNIRHFWCDIPICYNKRNIFQFSNIVNCRRAVSILVLKQCKTVLMPPEVLLYYIEKKTPENAKINRNPIQIFSWWRSQSLSACEILNLGLILLYMIHLWGS